MIDGEHLLDLRRRQLGDRRGRAAAEHGDADRPAERLRGGDGFPVARLSAPSRCSAMTRIMARTSRTAGVLAQGAHQLARGVGAAVPSIMRVCFCFSGTCRPTICDQRRQAGRRASTSRISFFFAAMIPLSVA